VDFREAALSALELGEGTWRSWGVMLGKQLELFGWGDEFGEAVMDKVISDEV
jgi:hypothetical protein